MSTGLLLTEGSNLDGSHIAPAWAQCLNPSDSTGRPETGSYANFNIASGNGNFKHFFATNGAGSPKIPVLHSIGSFTSRKYISASSLTVVYPTIVGTFDGTGHTSPSTAHAVYVSGINGFVIIYII